MFTIEDHTTADKNFQIRGPGDLLFYVDCDDVNHDEVDELAAWAVHVLNDHWGDPPSLPDR